LRTEDEKLYLSYREIEWLEVCAWNDVEFARDRIFSDVDCLRFPFGEVDFKLCSMRNNSTPSFAMSTQTLGSELKED
jgi:hypothetical protein